jgi:hypothetical protein
MMMMMMMMLLLLLLLTLFQTGSLSILASLLDSIMDLVSAAFRFQLFCIAFSFLTFFAWSFHLCLSTAKL